MKIIYSSPCHPISYDFLFGGETCKERTGYLNKCIEELHDLAKKLYCNHFVIYCTLNCDMINISAQMQT